MDIKAMHRNGLSIRRLARATGFHRETVRRHLESNAFPEYHKGEQRKSIPDPFRKVIGDYLEEDDYQGTWIFEKPTRTGYGGSYTTVTKVVRAIKGEKRRITYIRFETEPGFQAQVDWATSGS